MNRSTVRFRQAARQPTPFRAWVFAIGGSARFSLSAARLGFRYRRLGSGATGDDSASTVATGDESASTVATEAGSASTVATGLSGCFGASGKGLAAGIGASTSAGRFG